MDPIVSKMTASPNVLLLGGTVQSVTFHICGDLGPEEKIQSLDEGYGYLLGPEQTEKSNWSKREVSTDESFDRDRGRQLFGPEVRP